TCSAACSQVNTAFVARKEHQATCSGQGSPLSPLQQYRSVPRRRHDRPLSASRVRPAARASSSEKGRPLSCGGIRGRRPTTHSVIPPSALANPPCKGGLGSKNGFAHSGKPFLAPKTSNPRGGETKNESFSRLNLRPASVEADARIGFLDRRRRWAFGVG